MTWSRLLFQHLVCCITPYFTRNYLMGSKCCFSGKVTPLLTCHWFYFVNRRLPIYTHKTFLTGSNYENITLPVLSFTWGCPTYNYTYTKCLLMFIKWILVLIEDAYQQPQGTVYPFINSISSAYFCTPLGHHASTVTWMYHYKQPLPLCPFNT